MHDGHMVLQGPNYALAKTSQNWRAAAAEGERRRSGGTSARVSANVAPASRTESMRHVKTVAVGLEGQKHFPPLVPFDADVASALMTALLLTDVFGPGEAEAEAEAEAEGGGGGPRAAPPDGRLLDKGGARGDVAVRVERGQHRQGRVRRGRVVGVSARRGRGAARRATRG